MMLLKWCTQYVSKFEKAHSGHKTGKGQFPFQPQRRVTPKNIQTTVQLCSLHMLSRLCSKCFELGFTIMWTKNFQMYKLKSRATRDQIASIHCIIKQGNSRKIPTSALLSAQKPFTMWIATNCGKFWKKWENWTTLLVSWETWMQVKKQQL